MAEELNDDPAAAEKAARVQRKEQVFLKGPHSRPSEFLFTLSVLWEFIRGFRKLHFLGPCVTVFGSARFKEGHKYYEQAREVGGALAKLGFTVMTGGGPGIMEAANRGAKEAGGRSAGCNIILPREQRPNRYLDHWVDIRLFFVRKVLLSKYSYAFIVMPGGYGTLDELSEAMTMVQTRKMLCFPVIVMGMDYHKHLRAFFDTMVEEGTIAKEDLDLLLFTDSVDEAMDWLKKESVERFGLRKTYRPVKVLGERE